MNQIAAIAFVLAAAVVGCSTSEAAPRPEAAPLQAVPRSPDGALPRLVFFMNPNGQPCQIQQRVLDNMKTDLEGKVELVVYRTTARGDVSQFERFGIRSLPAIVLTDPSGNEVRRATPGIQDAASIRRLIGQ